MSSEDDCAVNVENLKLLYGKREGLRGLSLTVKPGEVLGVVGRNGAGKTTLLKCILGLLRPNAGDVRVFGMDPVREPKAVLSRVGFLSEDRALPPWMTIAELMRYTRAFYPEWNQDYAEELCSQRRLDLRQKIRTLSSGQLAQVGLVMAVSHNPDLLVLDEPASGLDPAARRDFLVGLLEDLKSEVRTTIFSSHLLDDVDRVSTRVAIVDEGRMLLDLPTNSLRNTYHVFAVLNPESPAAWESLPNWMPRLRRTDDSSSVICEERRSDSQDILLGAGFTIIEQRTASLEDVILTALTNHSP